MSASRQACCCRGHIVFIMQGIAVLPYVAAYLAMQGVISMVDCIRTAYSVYA
jgi:hypothetical protein